MTPLGAQGSYLTKEDFEHFLTHIRVDKASGFQTSEGLLPAEHLLTSALFLTEMLILKKSTLLPQGPLKRIKAKKLKKKNYLCRRSPWLWCQASGGSPSEPEWPPCRAAARWGTWRNWWNCTSAGRDRRWNINNFEKQTNDTAFGRSETSLLLRYRGGERRPGVYPPQQSASWNHANRLLDLRHVVGVVAVRAVHDILRKEERTKVLNV